MTNLEVRETTAAVRTFVIHQLPSVLRRGGVMIAKGTVIAAALFVTLTLTGIPGPVLKKAATIVAAVFVGFPAGLLLLSCIWLTAWCLVPRRWILEDDRLRLRGLDSAGSLRWTTIDSWEVRPVPHMPGHDLLVLHTSRRWYRGTHGYHFLLDPSIDRGLVTEVLRSRLRAA